MIPRYQRILFLIMLTLSILMGAYLFRVHQKNREKFATLGADLPLAAPATTEAEPITFLMANDADGSLLPSQLDIALPDQENARLRALLDRLLAEYSLPNSTHPLVAGSAVADVFLLKLPLSVPSAELNSVGTEAKLAERPDMVGGVDLLHRDGQLAVVNLRGSFLDTHPSGVEIENLTLLSMIGTIHANMPQVTYVRFIVDGKVKNTLAGHIDLARIYPVVDTAIKPLAASE